LQAEHPLREGIFLQPFPRTLENSSSRNFRQKLARQDTTPTLFEAKDWALLPRKTVFTHCFSTHISALALHRNMFHRISFKNLLVYEKTRFTTLLTWYLVVCNLCRPVTGAGLPIRKPAPEKKKPPVLAAPGALDGPKRLSCRGRAGRTNAD
jgi:hypothetical protein